MAPPGLRIWLLMEKAEVTWDVYREPLIISIRTCEMGAIALVLVPTIAVDAPTAKEMRVRDTSQRS